MPKLLVAFTVLVRYGVVVLSRPGIDQVVAVNHQRTLVRSFTVNAKPYHCADMIRVGWTLAILGTNSRVNGYDAMHHFTCITHGCVELAVYEYSCMSESPTPLFPCQLATNETLLLEEVALSNPQMRYVVTKLNNYYSMQFAAAISRHRSLASGSSQYSYNSIQHTTTPLFLHSPQTPSEHSPP